MQGVRNALCNRKGWLLHPGTGLRGCWTPHFGQATFYIWLIVSYRHDLGPLILVTVPHCYVNHCSPYWWYHWLCVCILIFEFTKRNIWMAECLTVLQLTLGQEQDQKWTNCRYGCAEQHHSCNVNHERLGGWSPSRPPTPTATRTPRPPPPPCRRARQPV